VVAAARIVRRCGQGFLTTTLNRTDTSCDTYTHNKLFICGICISFADWRHTMSFTSIGKILPQNIKQSGIGRQIESAMVAEEMNRILSGLFGKQILFKVSVVSFKDKALKLNSISSIIAQEIHLRERKIIARLNERFGEGTVEKIKFSI